MSENQPECRGLEQDEKSLYLEFASKAWGARSSQADPQFFDWFLANPNSLGTRRDLIVLVEEDRIVGAHHLMRIPWCLNGRKLLIPSVHDLYVLPSHRSVPGGQSLVPSSLKLMLAAFDGEPHVALCGLSPGAEAIYSGLRIPSFEVFWLQKIVSRMRAGIQIAARFLGWRLGGYRPLAPRKITSGDHQILRTPSPTSDELRDALTLKPSGQSYPDWDLASYTWRFFHELGPKSMLLLARRNGRVVGRCAVSIGSKHGCVVARVTELLFEDELAMQALLKESEHLFSDIGAAVCLAVTSSVEGAKGLRASGWTHRKKPPGTRWFSRNKAERPEGLWISGGAWDFGCDARLAG